jgi:DNA-binding IclR family transcriptional regulator
VNLTTLRRTIPDATLLDWLELRQALGRTFTIPQLCDHWQLTQPAACRRAHRLEAAGLVQADAVGWPRQWRLMHVPLAEFDSVDQPPPTNAVV